jgi:hypothetical protein
MKRHIEQSNSILPVDRIERAIYMIRSEKVLLDEDLAHLYGVTTRVLNQAVRRHINRFPRDFAFPLTRQEVAILKSQSVTSSWGGRRKLPLAFTEQGVAMLSSVLKSERAIEMNIIIMRAFVKIRNLIYSNKDLAEEVEKMKKQIGQIFRILDKLNKEEDKSDKREIGFMVK